MANNTGKKFGGRTTGTPNKVTKEIRDNLKRIVDNEIEFLGTYMETLTPKERIELLMKIMPFVLPKVQPVGMSKDEELVFGNLVG